jgi:glycosyltransferase involved in cell wall biosynthesis
MSTPEYRIHIIYDVRGWAYHHRALALAARAPAGICVTIGEALPDDPQQLRTLDLVVLLPLFRTEDIARQLAAFDVGLLVSVNVGWPKYEQLVVDIRAHADALLFNNRDYYQRFIARHGTQRSCLQLSNGVDTTLFVPGPPVETRPPRVLWVGSKFAAELKGYALLDDMRADIEALGFELDLRLVDSMHAPATLAQMADWYRGGQILLVASDNEGTPNPALEAAACGTVLVSTSVGNIPELVVDGVNGIVIERSPASILDGLVRARANLPRLSETMLDHIRAWSWDLRAPVFFASFTALVDARRAKAG